MTNDLSQAPLSTAKSPKFKENLLKQVVIGCREANLRLNLTEIASLAGISLRTAQNRKDEIQGYWYDENLKDSLPPNEAKELILKRGIELGIKEVSPDNEPTSERMLGVILGTFLKVETDLLEKAESLKKVWTIGQYIVNIHGTVCRYKNRTQGVPIHSDKNLYTKYLLQNRNIERSCLDKLFLRSDDYVIGKSSKRWLSTELLEKYIEVSTNKLLDMISNSNVTEPINSSSSSLITLPHMLRQKSAITPNGQNNNIYNTKYPYLKIDVNNIFHILEAKINIIEEFEPKSKFSLLMQAYKCTNDTIYIPIKHRAKGSEYLGRTYNVFCSIRAHERLKLGYIAYDMSAALQSICLQLIKATRDDYPVLWDYTNDKEHKKRMRLEVAEALNIDLDKVKSKLTAFANGSVSGIKRHAYYRAFQEESDRLRKAVLKHVYQTKPKVLEQAIEQSKRELPEELDWLDTESKETSEEMRNKASVFFFVWTWYERDIRQAMLDVLEDGIEVHDAVYSKMDIDPKLVEKAVYEGTGFKIIIEQEKGKP